ncbi:serine/threonine protein kinase, partial [bacterium]
LRDGLDEFKTLRKEFQFRQGAALLSAISHGVSDDVQNRLRRVMDYDAYPKDVGRFSDSVDETLRQDHAAFAEARAMREAARRRRRLSVGLGALALGFTGFVVWLAKTARRKRLETVTALPASRIPGQVLPPPSPMPALPPRGPVPALGGPTVSTPLPRRPDPAPGAVLGGSWRVLSAAAPTPLGPVFEGEEVSGRRRVLIKRLRDELHRSEKDLDRILERARQVSSLKHPNLCEVYAVFVEDERVHIVSEKVDGKAVAEFLEAGRRINLSSARRVLTQAAKAVEHAHQSKVLHGDLTPQCVLVTREGVAKVSDFGVGIEARKTAAKLSWAETIGSPAYMAPEQELGAAFKESDVFSMGVMLYELVTGGLPFAGPNYLAQKRERAFKAPSSAAPGLSAELDAFVSRALAPEPQHRFRSAADFAAALEKLPDA